MSALTSVNINGVPCPIQVEYTSSAVTQAYLKQLQAFVDVLNLTSKTNPPATLVSAGNLAAVKSAIQQFLSMAKSGVLIPDPVAVAQLKTAFPDGIIPDSVLATIPKIKSYMDASMATNLNLLLNSIKSVPRYQSFSTLSLSALQEWRDMAVKVPDIVQIVQAAQTAALSGGATRTLQSMIELDYVRTGNEVLGNAMGSLQSALAITKDVLNTLADLQNVHNDVKVASKPTFQFNYGTNITVTKYQSIYKTQASGFFGTPITPTMASGLTSAQAADVKKTMSELVRIRNALTTEISALKIANASAVNQPDSLVSRLMVVKGNISGLFHDNTGAQANSAMVQYNTSALYQGFRQWMLDSYSSFMNQNAANAGQYQQNITNAVTAAQSLNDTQKEQVRRYMFVFQEYYQSASAILTQLSQLIEKMAQNIGR